MHTHFKLSSGYGSIEIVFDKIKFYLILVIIFVPHSSDF